MLDRAKYLTLAIGLYLMIVAIIVAAVAGVFQRPFLDVVVNLAPAIVLCLIGTIVHGLRHDLDS